MVAILPTSSSHRRLCASDIWHLAGWRASQVSIYQHLARGKWLGKYTWSWLKYVEHVGSGSSNFMINIDVSLLWGKHVQRKSCFIGCLAARIVTFSKKTNGHSCTATILLLAFHDDMLFVNVTSRAARDRRAFTLLFLYHLRARRCDEKRWSSMEFNGYVVRIWGSGYGLCG